MRCKARIGVVGLMMLLCLTPVWACMTVIVGKDVSPTGHVLVAHNEDVGDRAMVEHGWVEPKVWPQGYLLPAEPEHAAIPQVDETYGFYWTQVKPGTGGYSNADGFLNENGVLVVSNSCADSKVMVFDDSRLTDGGIEYNLRRVVAERATSARDAVDIIIDMVETYGYVPSGRTYTVADKDEAWQVQIASGKVYVAVRCPSDEVVVIPNHYTVHKLSDFAPEDIICSENLISYAEDWWFYDPATDGEFDFAKVYQDDFTWKSPENIYRHAHAVSILQGETWTEDYYPFSVKPRGKVSVDTLKQIMREHYEGTYDDPAWSRAVVPGGAPHDTGIRRICTGTTVESVICQFSDTPVLTTLWSSFGRPCELPYVPLHPLTGSLPAEIDQMEDSALELERHLFPDHDLVTYENSGWQRFRDFENKVEMVYEQSISNLTRLLWSMEYSMASANTKIVDQADGLLEEGRHAEAVELLASFDQTQTTKALSAITDFERGLNEIDAYCIGNISLSNPSPEFNVIFDMPAGEVPMEESMKFGLGFLNTRLQYASPIVSSLRNVGTNRWQVAFSPSALANRIHAPGLFDFFLGGRTTSGDSFVAQIMVRFVR